MSDQYELGDLVDEGGFAETDIAAEHQLIAQLLWHPDWIETVSDLVGPDDFFDRAVGRIFNGLSKLQGFEPEPAQLLEWLGSADVAGRTGKQALGYLRSLYDDAIDADGVTVIADRIWSLAERRFTAQGLSTIAQPFTSKMGLLTWGDKRSFVQKEYEFLVEDLIPENELTIIIGATQAGKSFLSFHLAMCIARGVPFFGQRILSAVPVIWCAYEGGRGARGRMLAYENHHNLAGTAFPFAALTDPVDLWSKDLNVEDLITECEGIIRSEFGGVRPGALFIDTHNAATPGASEIDSEAVSKIRDRYRRLAQALGCAVIIIGHTNALGKHRGNELLVNNVDTVVTVQLKTVLKNRAPVQVTDDDRRDVRVAHVWKQREGYTGKRFDFVLPAIETGLINKFGEHRTSCVVTSPNWSEQAEAMANSAPEEVTRVGIKLTDVEDHFFKVLWKEIGRVGEPAPPVLGLKANQLVVHRATVSNAYKLSLIPEDGSGAVSANTIKSRWTRATSRLRKVGVIGFEEPFFYWTGRPVMGVPGTLPQRSLFEEDPRTEFPPDMGDFK